MLIETTDDLIELYESFISDKAEQLQDSAAARGRFVTYDWDQVRRNVTFGEFMQWLKERKA